MAEAILRNRTQPEPRPIAEVGEQGGIPETLPRVKTATNELLEELRTRWEDLKARTEEQALAASRSLRRELSEDAHYVRIRARYYHESRPLQTLSAVAAAGFVLGLTLGLWRR